LLGPLAAGVVVIGGCGLRVTSPDDFVLTRTGLGRTLTMVINDSGTITCNASKPRPISGKLLIQARDLVTNLDADAKAGLKISSGKSTVFRYTIKLQDGTISFPDTAAATRSELGPAEEFALEAAQGPCSG
jgi:hypothetical protein